MNQSAWSKAHIAAHFPPVRPPFGRETWLAQVLKWLCKKRKIILVRPGEAAAGCRTSEHLLDISDPWHGADGQAIHFGSRIHIVAARAEAVRSGQQEQNNRAEVFTGETILALEIMVDRAEKNAAADQRKAYL